MAETESRIPCDPLWSAAAAGSGKSCGGRALHRGGAMRLFRNPPAVGLHVVGEAAGIAAALKFPEYETLKQELRVQRGSGNVK